MPRTPHPHPIASLTTATTGTAAAAELFQVAATALMALQRGHHTIGTLQSSLHLLEKQFQRRAGGLYGWWL